MIISWTEYWRKMSILPIKAWFGDLGCTSQRMTRSSAPWSGELNCISDGEGLPNGR